MTDEHPTTGAGQGTGTTAPPFDPDQLRRRYREERDKRVRPDGNDQYIDPDGEFRRYVQDTYATADPAPRAPLTDSSDVVIVGGGFGGLLAGARLREAGIEKIRIVEKGADFGGTWYWNRYPGAQCDIESYIYIPLLEELGSVPSEKYAHAPEIRDHAQAIGKHYDLYDDACFQTEVTAMAWDEATAQWVISTDRGDEMRARFVCIGVGHLDRLKLPGIPGINTFQGHSFHTSRWDYDYTGGDCSGNLTGLHGKRVAIIGTGATGVQCIPYLGEAAEQLYVFQRTPSSIDVRGNHPTDPEWASALEPGWQQHRINNFVSIMTGQDEDEDLVNDCWTDLVKMFKAAATSAASGEGEFRLESIASMSDLMEMVDFQKMEQIRQRVEELVDDPDTAEALKPYYRQLCKRPTAHDTYLQTFNRPNVTLVDTKGHGVDRITPRGVVAQGVEYEVDCIIFASGFDIRLGADYIQRAGFEITGRDGLSMADKWADGAKTFHGFHSRGFPNCFIISFIQSGFSQVFTYMLDEKAKHVAYIIKHAVEHGVREVETTEAAELEWGDVVAAAAAQVDRLEFLESCTPGWYNNEGKPGETDDRSGMYASPDFPQILEAWREGDQLAGLELRPDVGTAAR